MILVTHVTVLLVVLHTSSVHGFSSGAPAYKCPGGADMVPSHGTTPDQNSLIPYTLSTSSNVYSTGTILDVTLSSSDGRSFIGCLIKAEDKSSTTVGTIVTLPAGFKTLACPDNTGQGITHSIGGQKFSLTFQWKAPDISTGDINFLATIVGNYSTFWSRRSMEVLKPDIVVVEPPTVVTPLPQTTFVSTSTSSPLTTTTSSLSNQVTGTSNMPSSHNPNPRFRVVPQDNLPNEWTAISNTEETSADIQNAEFRINNMPIQSEIPTGRANALVANEMTTVYNQANVKLFSNALFMDARASAHVNSRTLASSRYIHKLTDASTTSSTNLPITETSTSFDHTHRYNNEPISKNTHPVNHEPSIVSRKVHKLTDTKTSSFNNVPNIAERLISSIRTLNFIEKPITSRNASNFLETHTTASRNTPNLVETSTTSVINTSIIVDASTSDFSDASNIVDTATSDFSNASNIVDTSITTFSNASNIFDQSTYAFSNTSNIDATSTAAFSNTSNIVATSTSAFSNTSNIDATSTSAFSNASNIVATSTSDFRNTSNIDATSTSAFSNASNIADISTSAVSNTSNVDATSTTSFNNAYNIVATSTNAFRNTSNLDATSISAFSNASNIVDTSTSDFSNASTLVETSTTSSSSIMHRRAKSSTSSSRNLFNFVERSTTSRNVPTFTKASTTLSPRTPLVSSINLLLNNVNVSTNEQDKTSSLGLSNTSADDAAVPQSVVFTSNAESNSSTTEKNLDTEKNSLQVTGVSTTPSQISTSQPSLSTTTALENEIVDTNNTASKTIGLTNATGEMLHDKEIEVLNTTTSSVTSRQSGGKVTEFDIANITGDATSPLELNISSGGEPLHVTDAEPINYSINYNMTASNISEMGYTLQNVTIPSDQSKRTLEETLRTVEHVVNSHIETETTPIVTVFNKKSNVAAMSASNLPSVTTEHVTLQPNVAIKHSEEKVLKLINIPNASIPTTQSTPIEIDSTTPAPSTFIENTTLADHHEIKTTAKLLSQDMRTEVKQEVISRTMAKLNKLRAAERLAKEAHTKPVSTFAKSSNPARSTGKIDKGSMIEYDPACGYSKGCFTNCEGINCQYLITWQDRGNSVRFSIQGKPDASPDVWVAVGFSSDKRMEDDSVTECVYSNGIVQAFNSYNPSSYNRRLNPPQLGLTLLQGSFLNGVFRCTFDRVKQVPSEPEMFDLERDWHIMFAHGPATQLPAWGMRRHSITDLPPVSASRVDFQSFDVENGSVVKYQLVKVHGCLMILAWVLFTGVGVVAARYYKNVWADKTILKLKIWFQIHRASMVCTLIFNVIAFIIIFVEAGGYSEIPEMPGKTYLRSHPVIGIIITILCVSNPIMAIFRPGPDSKKRPIFNWAHWGVGMTAYILSAICICFGFQLGKSSTPDYAVYIMIVYVLYIIIFDVLFEVLDYLDRKQQKAKVDSVEMSDRNGTDNGHANGNGNIEPKEKIKRNDRVKTVLLALHLAFTAAFALILILVVALN